MIKRPDQRIAIFIDAQNMYHSAKHVYGARVNFAALVDAASAGRPVIRAIAYVAKSKTGEEQAFFDALIQSGIELKIKDVQEFASGEKKADWDVGMTVDAISISEHVDAVVLATGDGDFVPLVEYLRGHGVLCEVVAFAESTNSRLRDIADSFLDVSSDPDQFLIRSRGEHSPRSTTHASSFAKATADRPRGATRPHSRPPESGEKGGRKIRVTF